MCLNWVIRRYIDLEKIYNNEELGQIDKYVCV